MSQQYRRVFIAALLLGYSWGHKQHGPPVAEDGEKIFDFGEPVVAGSGCERAEIVPSVVFGKNAKVSVLLHEYVANTENKTRVRKNCAIAVPVTVKKGFSIGIVRVDYRGAVYVPDEEGSKAMFRAEYFFAGAEGPKRRDDFPPGFDDEITLTDDVGAIVWTPCDNTQEIFRINTSITSKKKQQTKEDTQIVIDSAIVTDQYSGNQFIYWLQYARCDENSRMIRMGGGRP